jgi:hypothetical protein
MITEAEILGLIETHVSWYRHEGHAPGVYLKGQKAAANAILSALSEASNASGPSKSPKETRDAVIEECARVCDREAAAQGARLSEPKSGQDEVNATLKEAQAKGLAAGLRALKSSPVSADIGERSLYNRELRSLLKDALEKAESALHGLNPYHSALQPVRKALSALSKGVEAPGGEWQEGSPKDRCPKGINGEDQLWFHCRDDHELDLDGYSPSQGPKARLS